LSEALAAELQPFGIRVTVVESGCLPAAFINTRSFAISARKINDYRDTSGAFVGSGPT
jgi:NAD(P)-dependent dehydrogenase (short-subunit alcohol dehydrogenase family)